MIINVYNVLSTQYTNYNRPILFTKAYTLVKLEQTSTSSGLPKLCPTFRWYQYD